MGEICDAHPVTVTEGTSIREAAREVMEYHQSFLIVTNAGDNPIGIITERDFMNLVGRGMDLEGKTVEDVMSTPLITLDRDATVEECQETMKRNGIKHVVVVDGERLHGVVTLKEILFNDASLIVKTNPVVLYVINKKNGLLIFEFNFKSKKGKGVISGDLFTGAFSSFNTLFPEILGNKGKLKFIEIEKLKILIEYGQHAIFIIIQDEESIDSRTRLKVFKKKFEMECAGELRDYSEKMPLNVFVKKGERIIRQIFASKLE